MAQEKDVIVKSEKPSLYTIYYSTNDIYSLINISDIWERLESVIGRRKAMAWRFLVRSFLLSQLSQAANFTNYVINKAVKIGIDVDVTKRVEELEDGFRFIIEARITNIDFKEVKRNWKKIYWYLKGIDHFLWEKMEPSIRRLVKDVFVEAAKEEIYESVSEYRVVREEDVNDS